MDIQRIIKKLALLPAYAVAIREAGSNQPYHVKYPSMHRWYADPFVCHDEARTYVFVELMHAYHRYGQIAVALVEQGKIGDFRVVLDEPFHLSFPNVFQWQGVWYMLPETKMSHQLRLYRAKNFPGAWELDHVLLDDVTLVDHALFPQPDGFLVVSHDTSAKRNRIYHLLMTDGSVEELHPAGKFSNSRPGGTFYQNGGRWQHVIQDCKRAYGDFLHVYETTCFTERAFEEREICTMSVNDVAFMPDNHVMEHLHTYNTDGVYEVIDLQYMKWYLDKMFIHWWQEYLEHRHR